MRAAVAEISDFNLRQLGLCEKLFLAFFQCFSCRLTKLLCVLNILEKNYSKILISSREIKSFLFRIFRSFQNDI